MARRLLTKKRERWVQNRDVTLQGKPLRHNIANQDRYVKQLEKVTRQMTEEVNREVRKLFETSEASQYFAQDASIASMTRKLMNRLTKKHTQLFNQVSNPFAEAMVNRADKQSKSSLHSSLEELSGGLSIKTDFITGQMGEVMKATVSENVDLIRAIPQKYLTDVRTAVMRSITQPDAGGLAELQKSIHAMLDERNKQVLNKAKNTALDQTRKAYNHLNASRMAKVGVDKYKWVHSGGGQKPREYHRDELNGKVFSLDDPPVIDERTGERGIPGDAINCRCTMLPIIEFDEGIPQ